MPDSPLANVEVDDKSTPANSDVKTATADSSSADKGAENKTLLESVQAALKGPEKSPGSENQDPIVDPKAADPAKEEPLSDEVSEQEMKGYGAKTQRRMRQLLDQRTDLRGQVDSFKPKADEYDKIIAVAQKGSLSKEDLDNTMAIASAIKVGDPRHAIQLLTPIMRSLLSKAGIELPADLKQRVQEGTLSEADARDLSMARAASANSSAQAQREREEREVDGQRQAQRTQIDTVAKAADAWHSEKAKTDPDWSLKQGRVAELVELEVHRTGKYPASEKELRKLCDDALKKVDEELKQFKPAPRQHKPLDGPASPQSRPEPKTALEAAKLALAG